MGDFKMWIKKWVTTVLEGQEGEVENILLKGTWVRKWSIIASFDDGFRLV